MAKLSQGDDGREARGRRRRPDASMVGRMRRGAAGKPRARRSIAVLSPLLASGKAGAVLSGVVSAATELGVRVVAIQTLGGGMAELPAPAPTFALPAAWELVSGLLVVMNAVDSAYLEEIRAAGKPVVLVAPAADGAGWPVVEADSQGGTRRAVAHLVEHGHRRIGFVGCLAQPRARERHSAYREGLAAYGIAADGALLFDAPDDGQPGGAAAAAALLGAGMPATAVIAATDANAVGLMTVLGEAGLQLPRDLAVVGFDDVVAASSAGPALSTVHLSLEAVGRRAASLLIGMEPDRPAPARRHLVAATFVARESCGCTATSALQLTAAHGDLFSSPEERLRLRLEQLLAEPGGRRRVDRSALDRAVRLLTAGGALDGGREADLRRAAAALRAVNPHWPAVPAVVDCLHEYRRELGRTAAAHRGEGDVERGVTRLAVELSRSVVEEETSANDALRTEAAGWFQLAMALLGGSAGDPSSLGWLAQTGARAACLGLWSKEPAGGSHEDHALRLTGTHVRDPGVGVDVPAWTRVEAFPPPGILDDLDWGSGELAVVLPIRTRGMDLGLLAMVTELRADRAGDRDQLLETSALLSVAIEREVMVEWLRSQTEDLTRAYKRERDLVAELQHREKQLRHSAHHDPLTGLPNRTLFLDRLTQALARAGRRPGGRVALLFLDLDGFKDVNDSLGHLAGDRLLMAVAERISQRRRRGDTAARLGGDEFAVLLEDVADAEAVAAVADDLSARLAAPFALEGKTVTMSASVGAAITRTGLEAPDELLRHADAAMYAVKAGRHAAKAEIEVGAVGVSR
jgi:diguanylate cyclase (GGDEF)-like protein